MGFLLVAWAWVTFTDPLVDPAADRLGVAPSSVEVGKGLVFVSFSGLLLWVSLRRFERELLRFERSWYQVADQALEGMFTIQLGTDPQFTFVNGALEQITGWPASWFYDDVTAPLQLVDDTHRAQLRAQFKDPDAHHWPVRVPIDRHGERRWVRISAAMLQVPRDPGVLQGVVSDVTDEVEQELALQQIAETERQVADELRRADEVKQAFLTAVSMSCAPR